MHCKRTYLRGLELPELKEEDMPLIQYHYVNDYPKIRHKKTTLN